MKGLTVSRRFFAEWGLPWLEREFPDLAGRVAAGRINGSDVIGADDEWSRDHDWGPRFRLWLTSDDYRRFGRRLVREVNAVAPRTFMGAKYHFFGKPKDNIMVESIDRCFESQLGRAHAPARDRDWLTPRRGKSLVDNESWLYFMRHGPVFHDPLGEFTARREAFSRYPQDVRYKLMADLCLGVWALGEYKFCSRHVHRRDPVAIQICLGLFVQEAMRLCFLIDDDFAPHEVWIHHEFRRLPEARTLDLKIRQLVGASDLGEQRSLVLDICRCLRRRLVKADLIDSDEPGYGLRCQEIKAKIQDRWIRET